jgi:hypothetical protein
LHTQFDALPLAAGEVVEEGQDLHCELAVDPASGRYVPLGQESQDMVFPMLILYLPGKQAAQAPLPLSNV